MAKSSNSKKSPPSDDRNLVDTSASAGGVDLEDQLAVFLNKHKQNIIYAIIAIFVVVIGYYGIKGYQASSMASLQEGYAATSGDDAAREKWANDNSGSPLAGMAFKELADKAYGEGEYAKAAELYEKSSKSSESAMKEAAKLGWAMALLLQDKSSEAATVLEDLASSASAPAQLEAKYRLLEIAVESNDTAKARTLISNINESILPGEFNIWIEKTRYLESQLPSEES